MYTIYHILIGLLWPFFFFRWWTFFSCIYWIYVIPSGRLVLSPSYIDTFNRYVDPSNTRLCGYVCKLASYAYMLIFSSKYLIWQMEEFTLLLPLNSLWLCRKWAWFTKGWSALASYQCLFEAQVSLGRFWYRA